MIKRCSFCTLWLPTLLISLLTVVSFSVIFILLHNSLDAMLQAHKRSSALTKKIEKMVSCTLNATFLGSEERFLQVVLASNEIQDTIALIQQSDIYDTTSLLRSYEQLYKNLISAVSYSRENRLQDAQKALEAVQAYTTRLEEQITKLNAHFIQKEKEHERTLFSVMLFFAFLLLFSALFNGFYLIPQRVIRPMEEAAQKLQKSQEKYRIVADWTYDWEYWVGKEQEFIYMAPSVERITGYKPQEFFQKSSLLSDIIHPDDIPLWLQHVKEAHLPNRPEEDAQGVEFRVIAKDGRIVTIDHICRPVYSKEKEFLGVRVANRDITLKTSIMNELKEKNKLLDTLATTDGLSGLYNRRYFNEAFERELVRAKRTESNFSLVMCDIDFFKHYNDTYGHQMGDGVIQRVAGVLKATFSRGVDVVARYGGEEFVVLVPFTSAAEVVKLVERARESIVALQIKHTASKNAPYVTMSFGVTSCTPDSFLSPDKLLKIADDALYKSKERGRNCVTFVAC